MRTIKRTVVGGFIFSSDAKLLLGKSARGTYEGTWIIPGGGVERGETYEQALIREILEETGIDLSTFALEKLDMELRGRSKKRLKDSGEEVMGEYEFINFIVKLPFLSSEITIKTEDDFIEPMWCSVDKLGDMPLPPPTITSLRFMGLYE